MVRGWWVLGLVVAGVGLGAHPQRLGAQTGRRPGQAHAAGQFLGAVLRADYQAAYSRLAPEVRQAISLARFEAQARPIWKSGQRHGKAIELYKLGVRLGERNSARLFYSFSFTADSSLKTPSELLDVTFRDTATRAVLSFGLNAMALPVKKAVPLPTSQNRANQHAH